MSHLQTYSHGQKHSMLLLVQVLPESRPQVAYCELSGLLLAVFSLCTKELGD